MTSLESLGNSKPEAGTPTDAFLRGQKAGVQAEEAPILQQIASQVLAVRSAPYLKASKQDIADLENGVGFRRGYSAGLQEFLTAHNVDMRFLGTNSNPEGLKFDDVLVCYLRGLQRQSPSRGRDIFQRTVAEKPFGKPLYYELEPEWLVELRFRTSQQQGGYKLGFLTGIAKDFNITLTGFEIPSDNPSYEAFMQGLRGEERPMPFIELKQPKDLNFKDYGFQGMWALDRLDETAYAVGQKVWLASEGIDVFYAIFIRHPEALRAFKVALEGQILPESIVPKAPIRSTLDELLFNEPQGPDPLAEARTAAKTGYEMGILARQGRLRKAQTNTSS